MGRRSWPPGRSYHAARTLTCGGSSIDDHYPLRFGPLAAPFQAFLIEECRRWEHSLRDDCNAGTWYYNLVRFFTIGERIAADGGDVREGMRQWSGRLAGKQGLGELRSRAAKLAALAAVRDFGLAARRRMGSRCMPGCGSKAR